MNKVQINENFIVPTFQTVNKNQSSTQFILMDPQNNNLYLLHQYYCITSQQYSNLIALLQTQAINDNQCPYILNPVVYLPIRFTNQQYQTSHFVQVIYQYGTHNLYQQLYLKMQQKIYFEQHQIWSVLGSCVLALKSLKDKQFNHNSICLNDIFLTKQGEIKLCHPMIRTYDHYYQTNSIDDSYLQRVLCENYYFSPQQLSINQKNKDESLILLNEHFTIDDYFKCDIFSLGMSILALCILQPIGDCYVRMGGRRGNKNSRLVIDSNRLEEYFYALQQMYTNELLSLLSRMVTYQPMERISIDQLAQIIQQMIQVKLQQQPSQIINDQLYEEEQGYLSSRQPSMTSNSQYQSKLSMASRNSYYNYQQNQYKQQKQRQYQYQYENEQYSSSKFGKFSRVSQASPISGKKSKYSTYKSSKISANNRIDLIPYQIDNEDKPSPVAIQSINDYETPQINQELHMIQSHRYSFQNNQYSNHQHQHQHYHQNNQHNQCYSNNQTVKRQSEKKNITPTIKSSQSQPVSTINQTLKQYINYGSQSSISEVNQTRTYEEYNRALDAKIASLPKQVVSVMTSKQLCSLPSDSISYVQDKYAFWKSQNNSKTDQKENQSNMTNNNNKENQMDMMNNIQNTNNLSKSNKKTTQNYTHSHYIDLSKAKRQSFHPLSSRTYIKKQSAIKKSAQENAINQCKISPSVVSNFKCNNSPKNSFTIFLSKDYQNILKNKNQQDPNSMYTDPKFLQAIKQDVSKILTKRGLQVTSSQTNIVKQQQRQTFSNTNKPVFINGKKVQDNTYQPIYSQYKLYQFQTKPVYFR